MSGILKTNERSSELVEYTKLNDSDKVYFYIEEKKVKFNNLVRVINFKKYKKKVSINEIPEVIYIFDSEPKFITFLFNIKYEVKNYLKYHYNDLIEIISNSILTY